MTCDHAKALTIAKADQWDAAHNLVLTQDKLPQI